MSPDLLDTAVATLLARKGVEVVSIAATATAREALRLMVGAKVGSVLVVEGENVLGIFTERDYTRRVAAPALDPDVTNVLAFATREVIGVSLDTTVRECLSLMSDRRLRHLPVMEDGRVVGMVSQGDCTARLAQDRGYQVRLLVDYILGAHSA